MGTINVDLSATIADIVAQLADAFPGEAPSALQAAAATAARAMLGDVDSISFVKNACSTSGDSGTCALLSAAHRMLCNDPAFWIAYYAVKAHAQPLPANHPYSAAIRGAWPTVPVRRQQSTGYAWPRRQIVGRAHIVGAKGWGSAPGPNAVIARRNRLSRDPFRTPSRN